MVYAPREDTFLLARFIPDYVEGTVLEIGTGSGYLAQLASEYAEHVDAVDVDPSVVEYCRHLDHNPNIRFFQSDLFSEVQGAYDIILFNPPYLPDDPEVQDVALDGGKEGYEIIEKFLEQAQDYLTQDGKILMVFSSLTDKDKVDAVVERCGFSEEVLATEQQFFETLYCVVLT